MLVLPDAGAVEMAELLEQRSAEQAAAKQAAEAEAVTRQETAVTGAEASAKKPGETVSRANIEPQVEPHLQVSSANINERPSEEKSPLQTSEPNPDAAHTHAAAQRLELAKSIASQTAGLGAVVGMIGAASYCETDPGRYSRCNQMLRHITPW